MSTLEEVSIPLSKRKLVLLGIGGTTLVFGGAWMLSRPDEAIRASHSIWPLADNPYFVHGVGLIAVILFGAVEILMVRKLFDKKPGLQLTKAGIVDNASGVAAGLIPWSDITDFEIFKFQRQKSLVVKVIDPEKYVRAGNPIRRALNRANYKMCGSPIAIPSIALKIDFNELVGLITKYKSNYSSIA